MSLVLGHFPFDSHFTNHSGWARAISIKTDLIAGMSCWFFYNLLNCSISQEQQKHSEVATFALFCAYLTQFEQHVHNLKALAADGRVVLVDQNEGISFFHQNTMK